MKRVITVEADEITIVATIDVDGIALHELEEVRSVLAARLKAACDSLPYGVGLPVSQITVGVTSP